MGSKKRFERRELLKVIKEIFTRFECLLQVLAGSQRVMPGVMGAGCFPEHSCVSHPCLGMLQWVGWLQRRG